MKALGLKAGDILTIMRRSKPNPGHKAKFMNETWDVISVTEKSVLLQQYPTYARKRVKL